MEVMEATDTTPNLIFDRNDQFFAPDCDYLPVPIPAGGALAGETGYQCTGGGDCTLLVADRRINRLFEMFDANIVGGTFTGGCLAAWDMTRVYDSAGRGEQCVSADAAGLPITPLLLTADEVASGTIAHALRFVLPNSRIQAGNHVHPATSSAAPSGPAAAPPMGSRWRLRADFPLAGLPSDGARVVARALQQYGMVLADTGTVTLIGRTDRSTAAKWTNLLGPFDLQALQSTDFEVLATDPEIPSTHNCVRTAF
jgi:serine/threonine-protein kinase